MSSNRFYLPSTTLEQGLEFELPEETSRQVSRVLRMRENDRIVLFDGSGSEWPAAIVSVRKDLVSVSLGSPSDPGSEPTLQVSILQALVPAERMEFVIQKSTELGAAQIIPIITERVQAKDENVSQNRRNRWERIAVEAAEQSGRTRVPEVLPATSLADSLTAAISEGPIIVLWEEERQKNLKAAVQESLSSGSKHVSILIGPVGGLSGAEADAAMTAGGILAGAGPRILRAETAPVVALTALMLEAGELGGTGRAASQ